MFKGLRFNHPLLLLSWGAATGSLFALVLGTDAFELTVTNELKPQWAAALDIATILGPFLAIGLFYYQRSEDREESRLKDMEQVTRAVSLARRELHISEVTRGRIQHLYSTKDDQFDKAAAKTMTAMETPIATAYSHVSTVVKSHHAPKGLNEKLLECEIMLLQMTQIIQNTKEQAETLLPDEVGGLFCQRAQGLLREIDYVAGTIDKILVMALQRTH